MLQNNKVIWSKKSNNKSAAAINTRTLENPTKEITDALIFCTKKIKNDRFEDVHHCK